jgi:hypothetical protein
MNASGYSEDEYSQSRESTLQQIEHAYSTRQKVQTNPNSLSGKQHYNKLQQHTRQAIEKQVNLLHHVNLFFLKFFDWVHTHAIRSNGYSAFSSISIHR